MRLFLTTVGVLTGIAAAFAALTYPRYHREMVTTKARLMAGSEVLTTAHGEIEYAVQAKGHRFCRCMGRAAVSIKDCGWAG